MQGYKVLAHCAIVVAIAWVYSTPVAGQYGARNTVPETVSSCYVNTTAYNRFARQPMHINNLIAIIRKIERKEPQLSMRRIARIIVNRYMFDGLKFDPSAKLEFQFSPKAAESIKTQMIKNYIPLEGDEKLAPGVLDNDELCALHWMLSHSMNATVRYEEQFPYGGYNPGGYQSGGGGGSYNNPGYNNNYNTNSQQRWKRSVNDSMADPDDDKWSDETQEADSKELSPAKKLEPENPTAEDSVEASPVANSETENKDSDSAVQGRSAAALSGIASDDDDASKSARQVSTKDPTKTRRPIETGVVYTDAGSISAGRLLGGIAAGLQPMTIPITSGSPYPTPNNYNSGFNPVPGPNPFGSGNNNYNNPSQNDPYSNPFSNPMRTGRKRRQIGGPPFNVEPLQNIHAATLAGDVGQAAVRNGKYSVQNAAILVGVWNDTICPREYILNPYPYADKEIYMDDAALTYMSEAEVRGGMDGLILGTNIVRWDNAGYKLSEVLEMYYSEGGISGEPQFRSCNRQALYNGGASIDPQQLLAQSTSFAYLYNNVSQTIPRDTIERNPNSFTDVVREAYQRMQGVAGNFGGSDPPCKRRQTSGGSGNIETDDNLKYTEIKTRIYAVLDHSATYDEIVAQKRFIAQLALEIDIHPRGSRLGLVDGNSGQILISPNWTDTKSILACNILSQPTQIKPQNYDRVLDSIRTDVQKLRDEEIRLNYESDIGIVVLMLVQGKRLEGDAIRQKLVELDRYYGDVRVLFASSKYQQNDFDGYVLDPSRDFIRIQSLQNISDYADEFANELRKNAGHGRLSYTKCNSNSYNQDDEHKIATTIFVSPETIQYYKVSPDYFYSARNLRLRFTSDNGKVRICQSRDDPFPNSRSGAHCKDTTGSYVSPGNNQVDVEFDHSKPCGKHGNREGCKPIYLSFTPTEFTTSGQTGLDCSQEGCQYPNQVKVTFTHWDMRCNGATKNLPTAIFAIFLSLLVWRKFE